MKRILILILMLFFLMSCSFSQGEVSESLFITSKILNKNVNYSVYLPKDYKTSKRNYPVLYLLHGYTDNETSWIQFGEINSIADKLIENGEIAPMIIAV